MHVIREINSMRRNDMDKKQKFQLNAEDMREDAELRRNIIEALAYNVSCILPGGDSEKASRRNDRNDPDAQKAAESRQAAAANRTQARSQDGQNQSTRHRDQRQQ